jgi:hypothetical protein
MNFFTKPVRRSFNVGWIALLLTISLQANAMFRSLASRLTTRMPAVSMIRNLKGAMPKLAQRSFTTAKPAAKSWTKPMMTRVAMLGGLGSMMAVANMNAAKAEGSNQEPKKDHEGLDHEIRKRINALPVLPFGYYWPRTTIGDLFEKADGSSFNCNTDLAKFLLGHPDKPKVNWGRLPYGYGSDTYNRKCALEREEFMAEFYVLFQKCKRDQNAIQLLKNNIRYAQSQMPSETNERVFIDKNGNRHVVHAQGPWLQEANLERDGWLFSISILKNELMNSVLGYEYAKGQQSKK